MWDFLSKAGDFFKNNSDLLKGIGAGVSAAGNAYGMYKQGKMAEKNYKLNLDLLNDEKKRQKKAQESLDLGWAKSTYGA